MICATQLNLDAILRGLPPRVRLLELRWVERTFDLTEDQARELVDSGRIRFAFDLASPGAKRAEVRVYRDCVQQYAKLGDSVLSSEEDPTFLALVIRHCLPPGEHAFELSQLQRPWAVKGTHLHNLCLAGELQIVPGQTLKPKQSPLIERMSAVEFLQRRRIA